MDDDIRFNTCRANVTGPMVELLYRRLQELKRVNRQDKAVDRGTTSKTMELLEAWRKDSIPNLESLNAPQRTRFISRLAQAWRKSFAWFLDDDLASIETLIFAVQTYVAIIIRRFTFLQLQRRCSDANDRPESESSSLLVESNWRDDAFNRFGWRGFEIPVFEWWLADFLASDKHDTLAGLLAKLDSCLVELVNSSNSSRLENGNSDSAIDWFRPLIEDQFPPVVRKALGEYYTPAWLVQRTLDIAGYTGHPNQRILDPTCGSGAFICQSLSRWLGNSSAREKEKSFPPINWEQEGAVFGIEVNPLAVCAARANYVLAIADHLAHSSVPQQVPIYHADALLGTMPDQGTECQQLDSCDLPRDSLPGRLKHFFDVIIGNPPWVGWETLTPAYRRETVHLWQKYGLFQARGMQTILGHGKKDLSMLISYAVTDRFLKPSGRLAFVVTNSVFRNHGAGQGFREFQLSPAKEGQLSVERVDDFSALEPFPNISTNSCIFCWTKGTKTKYPVPYFRWSLNHANGKPRTTAMEEQSQCDWNCQHEQAIPSIRERTNSSWLIGSSEEINDWRPLLMPSFYRAYEGVNTGGANGVYWLQVIEQVSRELVRVRNMPECSKKELPEVEAILETRFLYPLVRGVQMRRWHASVDTFLLFVQDPEKRRGIQIEQLKSLAPRTLEYLQRFERELSSRAAYQRFFAKGKQTPSSTVDVAPFYSMFNVGSYTLSPFKVAWHRMKAPLQAAILEPIGERPLLPQETHAFIPVETRDHAVYLAALINSSFFNRLAEATSQPGGKSFGSPHLLERIHVPTFDRSNLLHQRVVEAGESSLASPDEANRLTELDSIATQVFHEGLSADGSRGNAKGASQIETVD